MNSKRKVIGKKLSATAIAFGGGSSQLLKNYSLPNLPFSEIRRSTVGEAKRRQKLDPNYGKPNVLKNACQHIDELLFRQEQTDPDEVTIFSLFTNNDRGCSEEEIDFLRSTIPLLYHNQSFTVWLLPQQYASLSLEKSFEYFLPLYVGDC